MARQFIYHMEGLTKTYPGNRKVLENIHLSFYPDAKIGVLGVNGSGKSTLLRIMAGIDKEFTGEGWVAEGARVGYLQQEPQLDAGKSVRENVMEGVAPQKAILDRYNELATNYSDENADEMTKLQDEIPQPLGLDLILQPRHLIGGLVGIVHGELVVAVENGLLRGNALHHVVAHALGRIELRLLLEVAYARTFGHPALADELLIDAGHDAQQGRLARAIDPEHADLGIGVERQVDVLQNLPVARIDLGEALHVIDELAGHERPTLSVGRPSAPDVGKSALM